MKAVNLIPGDARARWQRRVDHSPQAPTYAVLGLLAVALAFVTVYVLASNSIADKQGQAREPPGRSSRRSRPQTSNLVNYTQFQQLVQTRTGRSRRSPRGATTGNQRAARTSRRSCRRTRRSQTLNATVRDPRLGTGGASAGCERQRSLLGSTTGPAIELTGCTKSQDDVARLMSRLRLVDGVTRVTLGNSQKPNGATQHERFSSAGTSRRDRVRLERARPSIW